MVATLLLTTVAPDRPGLVETVAQAVAQNEGSWLSSRLCRLGGQFAGIIQVQVPTEGEAALRAELAALATREIRVDILNVTPPQPGEGRAPLRIELTANDRPGIVRDLTRCLAQLGMNVEDFTSRCSSAPMTGEPLFQATAWVRPPAGMENATIQAALELLADDLMVEMHPAELAPL